MGTAQSITQNAPELISSVMNEVSTNSFMKNSVEDTNFNSITASCDPKVIENLNASCLESIASKRKAANDILLELIKLNVPYNDAIKSANKILDMDNPVCNTNICNLQNITQKISRTVNVNDNTAANIVAEMQSSVNQKVDQIIKPEIEAGVASAKSVNDLGTKVKNTINNHITSTSVIETLRKFSNSNTINATNVGVANINQEIAGAAYASSITNAVLNNNSDVIAEMQAAMDIAPKLSTMKVNFGAIFAIIGVIGLLVLLIAVAFALKSQKNGMQFAKENPELIKMMAAAPAGPAGMAAMAASGR